MAVSPIDLHTQSERYYLDVSSYVTKLRNDLQSGESSASVRNAKSVTQDVFRNSCMNPR